MKNSKDSLAKLGFYKHHEKILTAAEITLLNDKIAHLLVEQDNAVDTVSANCPVIPIAGKDSVIDHLLEKILTDSRVKTILTQYLGEYYKIWQVNWRRSPPGDAGLPLHQDAAGEFGLFVLLSDNPSGEGATAFVTKSHLLPRWASKLSWTAVGIVRYFIKKTKGYAGEFGFFFNKTWHARLANHSQERHDILLISFFPNGGRFKTLYDSRQISSQHSPTLYHLLSTKNLQKTAENDYQVLYPQARSESYAMKIEGKTSLMGQLLSTKTAWLKVLLLEMVFLPIKSVYKLLNVSRSD